MSEATFPLPARLRASLESRRKWVAILMLATLYGALATPLQGSLVRALLVSHFGLFLLWQPFLGGDRKLDLRSLVFMLLPGVALVVFVSGWVMVLWLALLVAIIGGRVFVVRMPGHRLFYSVAFLFLMILLLVVVVPRQIVAISDLGASVASVVSWGLPLILLALAVLRLEPEIPEAGRVIDFFYSVLLFQFVLLLVLGSIALMRFTDDRYLLAVVYCVLASALALMALALLWSPPAGYGGLRAYFSRYLMTVGVPSELWLRRLAELADAEESPARFLEQTIGEVRELPWVIGAEWATPDATGRFGQATGHAAQFAAHSLTVTLYSSYRLSPALQLHTRLLVQLWGEFYEGKRREQALRHNAYMQAVHETGARLTHDIKNLLQSLYALASAGQAGVHDERFTRMLTRQLPELTKRLRVTLDQLRSPAQPETMLLLPATRWWEELKLRHENKRIVFHGEPPEGLQVPVALFDAVAENCIDNARRKRLREPDIAIEVRLAAAPQLALSIADRGSPISAERLRGLFKGPIEHADGMGIGLYQASRRAAAAGFDFSLAHNEPGRVEFLLAQRNAG